MIHKRPILFGISCHGDFVENCDCLAGEFEYLGLAHAEILPLIKDCSRSIRIKHMIDPSHRIQFVLILLTTLHQAGLVKFFALSALPRSKRTTLQFGSLLGENFCED